MQQDEHNKPVLVWKPNVYNVHMYDIIDMLMLEVHQQKNDYHPIKHDNVMDVMYLEYQHVNINKNHIPLDELLQHQQLYQVEYYHFYHTKSISDLYIYQIEILKCSPALFYQHRKDVYDDVFEQQ